MTESPSIKDDRVLEMRVNDRPVWIVRFTSRLFLKQSFDSLAELQHALGADQSASKTVEVQPGKEGPWGVIEFLLNDEPLYAVYNAISGEIGTKGTHDRKLANDGADRLNQRLHPLRRGSTP